jgi:glycine hydroxymethyltransferase
MSDRRRHFAAGLAETDSELAGFLAGERARQGRQIELIASENIVSRACLDALGAHITNKTVEGYPGNRFHGGAEFADAVETLAIERAKAVFGCAYANVQAHSGSQANQAVFFATVKPGDRVMSMDLAAGGHLSHGARPNMSGRWFEISRYGVDRETETLDYDAIADMAREVRPRLLIAGGSAYPRTFDFARFRAIADEVDALFLADIAHIAGLVAGGAHPSPVGLADFVTCTTTKTLRGPRGGVIMTEREDLARKINSAVFPGVQGSIHLQVIAAKAACLGEAATPAFRDYAARDYAAQVVTNARALAATLAGRGYRIVTGGTDTHLMLVDVSGRGLTGDRAEKALEACDITSNKNAVPFDSAKPSEWRGLRFGAAAVTTRGFDDKDMTTVGTAIADVLDAAAEDGTPRLETVGADVRARVATLCDRYPLYPEDTP